MPKVTPSILNDLSMTINGEPEIGPDGDFLPASGTDALLQSCMFRLKTVLGDWILMPECGASLERLVGEPNSEETAIQMEQMILRALTHDGFISSEEVEMTTLPVNQSTILVTLTITYGGRQTNLAVTLDLKEGAVHSFEP